MSLLAIPVNNQFCFGIFSLDKRLKPISTVAFPALKVRNALANVDRPGQSKKVESKKWFQNYDKSGQQQNVMPHKANYFPMLLTCRTRICSQIIFVMSKN